MYEFFVINFPLNKYFFGTLPALPPGNSHDSKKVVKIILLRKDPLLYLAVSLCTPFSDKKKDGVSFG